MPKVSFAQLENTQRETNNKSFGQLYDYDVGLTHEVPQNSHIEPSKIEPNDVAPYSKYMIYKPKHLSSSIRAN